MGDCGTIVVVDADDATRQAAVYAAARLGLQARAFENAELFLERIDDERPAVAILEVELPGTVSGLELLHELHERYGADLPVVLVSERRTAPLDRVAGLLLGADDYLVKPLDRGELLARLRRSLRRAGAYANGSGRNGALPEALLSPRELEILRLLASGRTQAEIARTLVISSKTVATHIQHVLAKLGVHSRAQAVASAYRLGLVEQDVTAHVLAEALPAS